MHYRTRIPRFGRDLAYDPYSAELMVGASSHDVYRLNLEEGRFSAPFVAQSDGINVVRLCAFNHILATGGENGAVEVFDPRERRSVAFLDVASVLSGAPAQGLEARACAGALVGLLT